MTEGCWTHVRRGIERMCLSRSVMSLRKRRCDGACSAGRFGLEEAFAGQIRGRGAGRGSHAGAAAEVTPLGHLQPGSADNLQRSAPTASTRRCC